jgi:hypothetical protein
VGIQSSGQEVYQVKIANGQELTSPGQSHGNTGLNCRAILSALTFIFYPLAGCDIVLGIQWLRTLGPILWDFIKLTMAFDHAGRIVYYKAWSTLTSLDWLKGDSFKLAWN